MTKDIRPIKKKIDKDIAIIEEGRDFTKKIAAILVIM